MQIKYKDYIIDVKQGTKVNELLSEEIKKSDLQPIACIFNNEVKRLDMEINTDGELELIDITNKDGMRVYRRGLIFLVCMAFKELFPEVKVTTDYQLYHSMFCTLQGLEVTDEILKKVKNKVDEIIKKNSPIIKKSMTRKEAIKFYKENDETRGKLQLELSSRHIVTLYYCEDYYNYLFGVMPMSTGYISQYELVKYDTGFLIRYPSRKSPEKVPELIESKKLYTALKENAKTHKILDVYTLHKLNSIIRTGQIEKYILLDEALHEKQMANIADKIAQNPEIKLIAIAGPSSSGKTTFAKRLGIELRINKIKPVTISVDNYFVEREDTPKNKDGSYNFECIEAIDTKLLNDHIMKLLDGKEIKVPTFNFHTGHKEYLGNTLKLEKDEVLIIEGIHCLNDELTFLIPKKKKFKIYISALTVLNIDDYNRISTTDTRLIRRIVRDKQYRGYTATHTLQMWPSVNEGEANNIFKYQEDVDVVFNSSLIYELNVLKSYAVPLLKEVEKSSPFYSEAKKLITMLSYFEPIDPKYVPRNSLLREFIGDSAFE